MFSKLMWIASLAALVFASAPADKCVCLPGQACWPSSGDWSTFNDTVGGKLTVIVPLGQPCHDPTFDSSACQAISQQYTNSTWKADQICILQSRSKLTVAGLQQVNWEVNNLLNETCYIDTNRSIPCGQGNLPVYGVAVESVR